MLLYPHAQDAAEAEGEAATAAVEAEAEADAGEEGGRNRVRNSGGGGGMRWRVAAPGVLGGEGLYRRLLLRRLIRRNKAVRCSEDVNFTKIKPLCT